MKKWWKKIKMKFALRLVAFLIILYVIYALINFTFRPSSPWTIKPEDQPHEIIRTKQQDEPKKARSVQNKTRARRKPRGKVFIEMVVSGRVVEIKERVKVGQVEKVYPPRFVSVEEFSRIFEDDPRYQRAYFTWVQDGDETFEVYEEVKAILNARLASKSDREKKPYLKIRRNF